MSAVERQRSWRDGNAGAGTATPEWYREWLEARAHERDELEAARRRRRGLVPLLAGSAAVAGLLPALLPLPGYSAKDTWAEVVASVLAGLAALAVVPVSAALAGVLSARRIARGGVVLVGVALLSAGAAAVHLAAAKEHFDEYFLFGLFFVGSGIAQLVWAILVRLRPVGPLLALGAVGNALIVALWAVDRIWGLPIGPEHWKPEPVGFGDATVSAFEVLLVVGCVALLARPAWRRSLVGQPRAAAVVVGLAVAALTVLGLLSALGAASSVIAPSA